MADKKQAQKSRSFDYPAKTIGTRAAEEARGRTNQLSEEKIDELYEVAKQISHGRTSESKVAAGH